MAKKEVKTDLWVARQLDDCEIKYDAQGSDVKELNEALQSASKRGTGNAGYPEYVSVVKDFVIVIEDKADLTKHEKLTDSGVISTEQKDVAGFAVNGAYFYAKHIAQNSSFRKVFAIGISGNEKHHKITPLYVDDRDGYKKLPDIESFTSFSKDNIEEYYTRYVLNEKTDIEKTTEEILKDAAELHEYLRTYGSLKDQDKPLVVSGILLALDDKFFKVDDLLGDETTTDGQLIYDAIKRRLKASNVGPDAKRDKLMSEFSIIRTSARLNEIDNKLGKTPLKFYTEFLKKNVFDNIKYHSSSEDFIGRFYGEFMSYSGGDGQTLGIVLTPRHICDLFSDLLNIQADDIVLDPCCGTAGFLVAAMHHMLEKAGNDQTKRKSIKKKQLHGFELQSNMFAIAATNMILRDDGNSNIKCEDFLRQNSAEVQLKGATVGMMNPPYSQGTKADPSQYELSFVEHLLDSLTEGARAAVIIPQSSMTGKTKDEQAFKENIMKHHTLEGVITCNTDYIPMDFIGMNGKTSSGYNADLSEDSGIFIAKCLSSNKAIFSHGHSWTGRRLLTTKTMLPINMDGKPDYDYMTNYTRQKRKSMHKKYREFAKKRISEIGEYIELPAINDINWESFYVSQIFTDIERGKRLKKADQSLGNVPYVSSTAQNNGVDGFINASSGTRVFCDCISLANSGSVGSAFYEPFDFVASDHVTHLKNNSFNKWIYLFLTVTIKKQSGNFNFNREINDTRIRNIKIMLPVNNDGNPDYAYMEQYAKNMMLKKYEQYLAFLDVKERRA